MDYYHNRLQNVKFILKVIKIANTETIINFLVQEKFMHYRPPKKLLSDMILIFWSM